MQVISELERGICNNCIYNTACILEQSSSSPIFHCNDYQLEAQKEAPLSVTFPIEEVAPEQKGLCGYCDRRNDCKLKTKDAIIITCEEYK